MENVQILAKMRLRHIEIESSNEKFMFVKWKWDAFAASLAHRRLISKSNYSRKKKKHRMSLSPRKTPITANAEWGMPKTESVWRYSIYFISGNLFCHKIDLIYYLHLFCYIFVSIYVRTLDAKIPGIRSTSKTFYMCTVACQSSSWEYDRQVVFFLLLFDFVLRAGDVRVCVCVCVCIFCSLLRSISFHASKFSSCLKRIAGWIRPTTDSKIRSRRKSRKEEKFFF